jgi:GTP cyclohydrolase IA
MSFDRNAAAAAIDAFLRAIGRDPAREPELRGTGERVADAFALELCDGYGVDADALLRGAQIEATSADLVVLRNVEITTTCPHHLIPAKGTAAIAFAPRGVVVGLGVLVRLIDAFAHRLTLQEEIGVHVAEALERVVRPEWVGCRLVLEHGCVFARGARRHGVKVETLALRGDLSGDRRATAERVLGIGT